MLVTLSGIVMDVKLVQSVNAPNPMSVTLLGIVIEAKAEQFLNVKLGILDMLLGNDTEFRPVQP